MNSKKIIKDNITQISALTEMYLKLRTRYKFGILISYVTPIISILFPIILMGTLFKFNDQFGPWTIDNFLVFTFISFNIILLKTIMEEFPKQIIKEKYWKTLTALIIAPFNRFNLLIGIFFSHLIYISIPFLIFSILCYIYYPISFITALFIVIIYFLIALIFSGLGLIISVFVISNENIWYMLSFSINLVFWFSCVTYPFEVFPAVIQRFMLLNPLYHIIDVLRLVWLEDDIILSFTLHPLQFLILILTAIIIPVIGVFIFNKVYKKYGISGY